MLVSELDKNKLATNAETKTQQSYKLDVRCRACYSLIEHPKGCNRVRCLQCRHEFCCACGTTWARQHYECISSAMSERRSELILPGSAARHRDELIEWCKGGFMFWEAKRKALSEDSVLAKYWVDLDGGAQCLEQAQKHILIACRTMACSFAIDLSTPTGPKYIRSRGQLQKLRAHLETELQPLVELILIARAENTDQGSSSTGAHDIMQEEVKLEICSRTFFVRLNLDTHDCTS